MEYWHCLPLWLKHAVYNTEPVCYLIHSEALFEQSCLYCVPSYICCMQKETTSREDYSHLQVCGLSLDKTIGFSTEILIFLPNSHLAGSRFIKVIFMLCLILYFFSPIHTASYISSAAWLSLWWISIMPRSPFIPVISLPFYWNCTLSWPCLLTATSHTKTKPAKRNELIKTKAGGREVMLTLYSLYFWHEELACLLQALPNIL